MMYDTINSFIILYASFLFRCVCLVLIWRRASRGSSLEYKISNLPSVWILWIDFAYSPFFLFSFFICFLVNEMVEVKQMLPSSAFSFEKIMGEIFRICTISLLSVRQISPIQITHQPKQRVWRIQVLPRCVASPPPSLYSHGETWILETKCECSPYADLTKGDVGVHALEVSWGWRFLTLEFGPGKEGIKKQSRWQT